MLAHELGEYFTIKVCVCVCVCVSYCSLSTSKNSQFVSIMLWHRIEEQCVSTV